MSNEYTSLEKYTSQTLFSKGLRKGWCWLCVRGELETEQTATYWPQVPLYYSSTSSSFCWAAQPGSRGPKPSVWRWLSQQHLVPNCDVNSNWTLPASNSICTQTVCGYWLYNCLTSICFPWALHLHRIQPRSQVKVIPRYLRPDAPVIYTGASLNWQLGRGPICCSIPNNSISHQSFVCTQFKFQTVLFDS